MEPHDPSCRPAWPATWTGRSRSWCCPPAAGLRPGPAGGRRPRPTPRRSPRTPSSGPTTPWPATTPSGWRPCGCGPGWPGSPSTWPATGCGAARRRPGRWRTATASRWPWPRPPPPSPAAVAERREERERWAELLAGLPRGWREAVVLRHVEGLPYAEVAEVLGRPVGTVKTHVHRGVRQLRGRWSNERSGQHDEPEPPRRPRTPRLAGRWPTACTGCGPTRRRPCARPCWSGSGWPTPM